jgi:hypothetical protein
MCHSSHRILPDAERMLGSPNDPDCDSLANCCAQEDLRSEIVECHGQHSVELLYTPGRPSARITFLRISEDLQLELGLREAMARVRDQTKILWLLVQWFQAFLRFAYRRALDWHTLAVHTT